LVFPQSILRPAQSSCTDDVCGLQSRWPRTADGFAVCGFSATLASLFSFARCEQPKQSMQDQKN
jgi:hypothetical protein